MTSVTLPSNRSFGILFLLVFAVSGCYGLLKNWPWSVNALLFLTSIMLATVTLFTPTTLAPLNRGWFHFGQLMNRIVSPIVLGIMFYGLVTPVALITKAFGRDELKLRQSAGESLWVERSAPVTENSFKNQF